MTEYVCEVLEENALLKIQNKELLARCDLLEAELCRAATCWKRSCAALRAALQKIADGRGMIPDKSTIYMNGKVPEVPKIFNKYDMQEIALAALVGEEGK